MAKRGIEAAMCSISTEASTLAPVGALAAEAPSARLAAAEASSSSRRPTTSFREEVLAIEGLPLWTMGSIELI